MSNQFNILRGLLIYGICLPLAIYLGYSLATPEDRGTLTVLGLVLLVLLLPLFLRWHYPLLIVSWNMAAMVFFLPGQLQLWVVMVGISLGISVFQRTLNRGMRFLQAGAVVWPLVVLGLVIWATAALTGGMGFRAGGGGTYGGKRYLLLFAAILGFFALISRPIPAKRAGLYVGMFILSGVTVAISSLVTVVSPSWYYIFLLFPADFRTLYRVASPTSDAIERPGGLAAAASCVFFFLLARHGIRGLLGLRNLWRLLWLLLALWLSLSGGFRSTFIAMMLTFGIVFYLEGLVRSRFLPLLLMALIIGGAIVIPFMSELPLPVQRTFSFLPIKVDPVAAADAETSSAWRIQMWKTMLPEVPHYLLLGKGFSIKGEELELAQSLVVGGESQAEVAMLAQDYHNGPLSVIIPLGIWGMSAFLWFLAAAVRALYHNYIYGALELKRINTFLLAYFLMRGIMFFVIVGSLYVDLVAFTGLIGLSISLNGGICRSKIPAHTAVLPFKKPLKPLVELKDSKTP